MTSNFIPDYNPGDDSFQIGGTIRTDQGMPAMMLDRVLTGFSPGTTPATPTEALEALRGFLTQTPLEVLQMFKPFVFKKDVDWDDQYGAVEGIMGTFISRQPIQAAWQEFLDKVANMFGGTGERHTLKDAIDSILRLLQIAQSARDTATNAMIGIAAINAAQKGGFSDDFNYPLSSADPPGYTSFKSGGGGHWAPNGKGVLSWRPLLGLASAQTFRQDSNPLPGNTGTVIVVVSKAPNADPVTREEGRVFVCACMSATSQECVRAMVGPNDVWLQMVNASGVATTIANARLPRPVVAGDNLQLSYTATTVEFLLNNTSVLSHTYTQPSGRNIGFGGDCPIYGTIGNLLGIFPAAEFAGLAYHP